MIVFIVQLFFYILVVFKPRFRMSSNKIFIEAVRALTKGQEDAEEADRDGNKKGVTVSDIERWLVSQKYYLTRDEFKCPLHVSLQKEVAAGKLERLFNGTYTLSKQQIGKDKAQAVKQKTLLKRTVSNPGKRGRPKKKVYWFIIHYSIHS